MAARAVLTAILFPALCLSAEISLSLTDNSDNELGFSWEGLTDADEWEVIKTTVMDVTSVQVDPAAHKAWRANAFNDFGYSGYTNILYREIPNDPSDLKTKPPLRHSNGRKKRISKSASNLRFQ